MLGAMFGWTIVTWVPLPFIVVLIVGMIFSGLAASALYFAVYRLMHVRHVPLMNIVIGTVGMSILLQNVSMLIWGSEPLAYPKFFAVETYRFWTRAPLTPADVGFCSWFWAYASFPSVLSVHSDGDRLAGHCSRSGNGPTHGCQPHT